MYFLCGQELRSNSVAFAEGTAQADLLPGEDALDVEEMLGKDHRRGDAHREHTQHGHSAPQQVEGR